MDLRGRTALVTGGTQGVGAAIAKRIAKAGGNVVIHGKSEDEFANATVAACGAMGVEATLICSDLSLPVQETLRVLSPESHPALSQVSLLVNNAGVFIDSSFLEMDETTWCKTFRINVETPYFLTQSFAKRWIAHGTAGRVLFTGSINGFLAEPGHTAYDASKAAVGGMVRSLCVALAPHRIRVNSIAPGLVRTPLTNQVLDARPDVLRWMELHTPNGQVPDAEVCGGLAVFLLSDEAEHIHGQTIFIDGGMSIWQQPDLPID